MVSKKVHPDVLKERRNGNVKPKELTNAFFGNEGAQKLQKLVKLVSHNDAFDTSDLCYLTRSERYLRACYRGLQFVKLVRENNLQDDDETLAALELMAGEDFFINLHLTMFIPTIENLADDDQLAYWLPRARDYRIIGTYAQTELGHGSNVVALQTTATLDLSKDEWVINTPNLEAMKWWPGGLAKSCNVCILMARVFIKEKDYGIHAFMFPVRDFETHQSLPGVMLIDIGQKMGYNGMDNGGMQLTNVRVPRSYLLQRYVRVDKDGTYTKVGDQKMLYATMTYTRKQIIFAAGPALAKAVTIATRYSVVRRQFPKMDQKIPRDPVLIGKLPEAQVLDYSTQQYTLFPMLATAVGFIFAGRFTDQLYTKMITGARQGDFSRLAELHVVTSSLKGALTMITIDGIEACRKAMGGHGYLLSSGIPLQFTSYIPQATYEGDFVVLSIQCGRSLLQMVQRKMTGKEDTSSSESPQRYVTEFDPFGDYETPTGDVSFEDPEKMLEFFERRSCALIFQSAQRMAEHIGNGLSALAALDEEKIAFTRIAKAHAHAVVLRAFKIRLDELKSKPAVHDILTRLYLLYASYWMEQGFAEFISAKVVSIDHQNALMDTIKQTLKKLRPDALSIVDGFGFPDFMLNSALGKADGNVYEALLEATKNEPLNKSDVTEGYYRYIQYILHPERRSEMVSAKL